MDGIVPGGCASLGKTAASSLHTSRCREWSATHPRSQPGTPKIGTLSADPHHAMLQRMKSMVLYLYTLHLPCYPELYPACTQASQWLQLSDLGKVVLLLSATVLLYGYGQRARQRLSARTGRVLVCMHVAPFERWVACTWLQSCSFHARLSRCMLFCLVRVVVLFCVFVLVVLLLQHVYANEH